MLTTSERDRRYREIRNSMLERGLETCVIASSSMRKGSIRYVSNHPIHFGEAYCVFPLEGSPTLFTFSPFQEQKAREGNWIDDIRTTGDYPTDIAAHLRKVHDPEGDIGLVQKQSFTIDVFETIKNDFGKRSVRDTDFISSLRMTKSDEEIALAKRSAEIADEAFRHAENVLEPGLTELDVYSEIKQVYYRNNVPYSFDLIGSGTTTHSLSIPTDRTLEKNDIITIELTPTFHGYFTQLAKQIPVGEFPKCHTRKERVRASAKQKGIETLEPGVTAREIYDAMAAEVSGSDFEIARRGGHGLGLEVNEKPVISPAFENRLQADTVMTIHPIVRDEQGVAIDADTYLITDEGVEPLNSYEPRE